MSEGDDALDYIRTARAKGRANEGSLKHAVRGGLIPAFQFPLLVLRRLPRVSSEWLLSKKSFRHSGFGALSFLSNQFSP